MNKDLKGNHFISYNLVTFWNSSFVLA